MKPRYIDPLSGRLRTRLACVGATILSLTGCQGGVSPPPLYLGHVANLSATEHAGKHAEQGIRLALKQLTDDNLADRLHGRPLHVRHTDTRGQLDAYESEAVRLAGLNRVIGLIGGSTPEEVARLDRGHVPLLTPCGVRPPGVSDMTFAIGMRPAQQAFILAKHAADDMRLDDVVLLADERREELVALADAFARKFAGARHAKGRVVSPPVPLRFGNDAKWEDLAKTIARRETKTIVFAGRARDWAELRSKLPFAVTLLFAGDDGEAADLQGATGKAPIYLATAFAPDPGAPRMHAFIQEYHDGFKVEPDVAAALGYEALRLHAEGLAQIGPTFTPEKLQAALREIKDFQGLAGPLTMGPDQYLRRPLFLARLDGGVLTMVKRYEPDALP
jgi:branched-chain amino acid transport system substrate-binding protein